MYYRILSFDRTTGTYEIQFYDPDHQSEVERRAARLNGVFLKREDRPEFLPRTCPAPRLNGVYLSGQALEDAIKLLYESLGKRELGLEADPLFPTDDPATVTGGEDIDAKVVAQTFTKIQF